MLNYDKLLDDWADMVYAKIDMIEEQINNEQVGSFRYGYLKGNQDAYLRSLAMLSLLEKRKKSKYIVEEDFKYHDEN